MKYVFKHYFPHPYILIPLVFVMFGIYCLRNVKNPYIDSNVHSSTEILIFGLLSTIIGTLFFVMSVVSYINNLCDIVIPYKNNKYIEIVGDVEELKITPFLGNGNDEFYVNGVKFSIGDGTMPGYQKRANNGGIITENVERVFIKYITVNNNNYIMELSVESTND